MRAVRVVFAVLSVLSMGLWGLGPTAGRASAAAPMPQAPSAARARPYLVLGDSISAGAQPGRRITRTGGYAPHVAADLARRGSPVRVTNLACVGETVRTMRVGGSCRYRQGSQQSAALAFLRAHPDTALVTVSLGANDLLRCASGRGLQASVDARCTQRMVGELRPGLTSLLTALRRAAPRAQVVVLDYYDPFQAGYLVGKRGAAGLAGVVRTQVNTAVHAAARQAGVRVAYVSDPFDEGWLRRVEVRGHGRVPIRVARVCTWTWMCSRGDIHPNDEGYRVIAGAVRSSLTRRR